MREDVKSFSVHRKLIKSGILAVFNPSSSEADYCRIVIVSRLESMPSAEIASDKPTYRY
jgi:hypothetical protein